MPTFDAIDTALYASGALHFYRPSLVDMLVTMATSSVQEDYSHSTLTPAHSGTQVIVNADPALTTSRNKHDDLRRLSLSGPFSGTGLRRS